MALSWLININAGASATRFDPPSQNADAGDVITWSNNDTKAHWPGLTATPTGPVVNPTFFMPNQIQPDDSSDDFRPGDSGTTLYYACSLHAGERGTIVVA